MKENRFKIFVFTSLLVGLVFHLLISANGNFIFHMDNARDMVDVREIVVLQHWRLIGPTSGIEGFYNGPAWYYIMAIPFLISGGDPYSMIILQIIFWLIGGYFLFQLIKPWGTIALVISSCIWIASDVLVLTSQNSLSTNPIPFLMPVFIYYLIKNSLFVWVLAALFFQLEMAFGFLVPILITIVYIISGIKFYAYPKFWYGVIIFALSLLPQFVFDLRHNWIMTKSVLDYLQNASSQGNQLENMFYLYRGGLSGLLMNNQILIMACLTTILLTTVILIRNKELSKYPLFWQSLVIFLAPLAIYLLVPMRVMGWHILAELVALLCLLGFSIGYLVKLSPKKEIGILAAVIVIVIAGQNSFELHQNYTRNTADASYFKNEVAAVDYAYQRSLDQNFKAYVYMPSVIDYPYQYLFWWYGLKEYGYTPEDYAYLPNQPEYIYSKDKFIKPLNKSSSGIIFLIEEPDRIGIRELWENNFSSYPLLDSLMIGPLKIEIRKETNAAA